MELLMASVISHNSQVLKAALRKHPVNIHIPLIRKEAILKGNLTKERFPASELEKTLQG